MGLYEVGAAADDVELLRLQAAKLRAEGKTVQGDALDDKADQMERLDKQPVPPVWGPDVPPAAKHKKHRAAPHHEDSGAGLLLAGGIVVGLLGLAHVVKRGK